MATDPISGALENLQSKALVKDNTRPVRTSDGFIGRSPDPTNVAGQVPDVEGNPTDTNVLGRCMGSSDCREPAVVKFDKPNRETPELPNGMGRHFQAGSQVDGGAVILCGWHAYAYPTRVGVSRAAVDAQADAEAKARAEAANAQAKALRLRGIRGIRDSKVTQNKNGTFTVQGSPLWSDVVSDATAAELFEFLLSKEG